MKAVIKGWVHHKKYDWKDEVDYIFWPFKMDTSPDTIPIFEHSFEVDIPDDFDPIPIKIEMLRSEKQRIQAEAHVKAANIERQIQELLCIENKVCA